MLLDEQYRLQFSGVPGRRPAFNSPFLMRIALPAGATLATGRQIGARLQRLLHRVIQGHPALRVSFSFKPQGMTATQHVFSLTHPDHVNDTVLHEFVSHARADDTRGGWRGDADMVRVPVPAEALDAATVATLRAGLEDTADGAEAEEAAKRKGDELQQHIAAAAQLPLMDMVNAPHRALFRFSVFYELAAGADASKPEQAELRAAYLMLNMHHAIFDGHSLKVLVSELKRLNNTPEQNKDGDAELPAERSPYFAYCAFTAAHGLFLPPHADSMKYWLAHLGGWKVSNMEMYLPHRYADTYGPHMGPSIPEQMMAAVMQAQGMPPPPLTGKEFRGVGRKVRSLINREQMTALKAIARAHECTVYSLLLTCQYITLWLTKIDKLKRKNGGTLPTTATEDVVAPVDVSIASAFSDREPSHTGGHDVNNECALLVNMLPCRAQFAPAATSLAQLLQSVIHTVVDHLTHCAIPLPNILHVMSTVFGLEAITASRGPFRNPLFLNVFLYEDAAYLQTYPLGGGQAAAAAAAAPASNDLSVQLCELPGFGCFSEILLKASECSEAVAAACMANESAAPTAAAPGADGSACMLLTWEWNVELFAAESLLDTDLRFHRVLSTLIQQLQGAGKAESQQPLAQLFAAEIMAAQQ